MKRIKKLHFEREVCGVNLRCTFTEEENTSLLALIWFVFFSLLCQPYPRLQHRREKNTNQICHAGKQWPRGC